MSSQLKFNPFTHKLDYVGVSGGAGTVLSVSGTANQILASPTTGNVILSLIGPYGPSTFTTNGILYGNGTSSIQATAAANNAVLVTSAGGVPSLLSNGTTGQVLTATTGAPPSWANLPAPPNSFQWVTTGSTLFTPANYTGYLLAGLSDVTVTLPAVPATNFWFALVNVVPGNKFTVAQNATDVIYWGNEVTTLGVGGSIVSSTNGGDTLNLVCWLVGGTHFWVAFWSQGNLTVN